MSAKMDTPTASNDMPAITPSATTRHFTQTIHTMDGNYAYFTRFPDKEVVVTKKNTQKIERKHLSLRTWCARLVRKGIRFSKTEQRHKIVVGLVINIWFFGRKCLIQ